MKIFKYPIYFLVICLLLYSTLFNIENKKQIDIYKQEISDLKEITEDQSLSLNEQNDTILTLSERLNANLGGFALTVEKLDNNFYNPKIEYESNVPTTIPLKSSKYFEITSEFGTRENPFSYRVEDHSGIDVKSQKNAEVISAADGYIEHHWIDERVYGKRLIINHLNRYRTVYAHLSITFVHERDIVKRGEVIGRTGNTGLSTGEHLHYEIQICNKSYTDEECGKITEVGKNKDKWLSINPIEFWEDNNI